MLAGEPRELRRGVRGEFKWSSQHLDQAVCGWGGQERGRQQRREGLRCCRRAARRQRGASIGNASGRRSLTGFPARTPGWWPVCRPQWERGGSVRVAACGQSVTSPYRGATCRSRSGRNCDPARQGCGVREFARRIGRAPSTISRQLHRSAATRAPRHGIAHELTSDSTSVVSDDSRSRAQGRAPAQRRQPTHQRHSHRPRMTTPRGVTDPALVAVVWDVLSRAGSSGGRVLEPGCGSGTFIGHASHTR